MIYFLRHPSTGLIKIGTTRTFSVRLQNLEKEYGKLEVLGFVDGSKRHEQAIHKQFHHIKETQVLRGMEWFRPASELLVYIKSNASLNFPLPLMGKQIFPKYRKPVTATRANRQIAKPTKRKGYNTKRDMKIVNHVARLIEQKEARDGRKIPMMEVAMAVGISRQALYLWLNNETKAFSDKALNGFCRYFNCGSGDLLERVPVE